MRNKIFSRRVNTAMRREEYAGLTHDECAVKMAKDEIEQNVLEDFMLNKIQTGEEIFFSGYKLALGIDCNTYELRCSFDGTCIDKNECVTLNNKDAARREFFDSQIEKVFEERIEDDYLQSLYELFCKVAETEVEKKSNKIYALSDYEAERVKKLLNAIKKKEAQVNNNVARYLSRASGNIFIRRMTDDSGLRRLQVADINIIEYKLAVLSVFRFISYDNADLFAQKLLRYFELR